MKQPHSGLTIHNFLSRDLVICNWILCFVAWRLVAASSAPAIRAAPQDDSAIHVPDGTEVRLMLQTSISGKTAKPNDPVPLQVLDDVKVGDLVLIANKAPALATVGEIQQPRRMMRAGRMSLKLDHVALVTGQTQKLRGYTGAKGSPVDISCSPTDSLCGPALVFASPFLLLAHGHEAILHKGAVFKAVLDGEAILDRASIVAHQPAPPPKKKGAASITFYWSPNGPPGGGRVACGRARVARLITGMNFTIHLPAGTYWFSLSDKKNATSLKVEPGGEYYFGASFIPNNGAAGGRNHMRAMEHDVGEAESSETQPLDSDKILDVASANADDLKADPRMKNKK